MFRMLVYSAPLLFEIGSGSEKRSVKPFRYTSQHTLFMGGLTGRIS